MKRQLIVGLLAASLVMVMAQGVAAKKPDAKPGSDGPNQGRADFVIPFYNKGIELCDEVNGAVKLACVPPPPECCVCEPGKKAEGDFSEKITEKDYRYDIEGDICKVTVKSGRIDKVKVLKEEVEDHSFTIELNKDVSNFVVWTCEDDNGLPPG